MTRLLQLLDCVDDALTERFESLQANALVPLLRTSSPEPTSAIPEEPVRQPEKRVAFPFLADLISGKFADKSQLKRSKRRTDVHCVKNATRYKLLRNKQKAQHHTQQTKKRSVKEER